MFIIMSGEYDDWSIRGVCDTEEEAKMICATLNMEVEPWLDDFYYYVEAEHLSFDGINTENLIHGYYFVRATPMNDEHTEFSYSDPDNMESDKVFLCSDVKIRPDSWNGNYVIFVFTDETDNDKIIKEAEVALLDYIKLNGKAKRTAPKPLEFYQLEHFEVGIWTTYDGSIKTIDTPVRRIVSHVKEECTDVESERQKYEAIPIQVVFNGKIKSADYGRYTVKIYEKGLSKEKLQEIAVDAVNAYIAEQQEIS